MTHFATSAHLLHSLGMNGIMKSQCLWTRILQLLYNHAYSWLSGGYQQPLLDQIPKNSFKCIIPWMVQAASNSSTASTEQLWHSQSQKKGDPFSITVTNHSDNRRIHVRTSHGMGVLEPNFHLHGKVLF